MAGKRLMALVMICHTNKMEHIYLNSICKWIEDFSAADPFHFLSKASLLLLKKKKRGFSASSGPNADDGLPGPLHTEPRLVHQLHHCFMPIGNPQHWFTNKAFSA